MPHTYVAIHICTNSYNGAQYSSLTAWLYMYPYYESLYHELQWSDQFSTSHNINGCFFNKNHATSSGWLESLKYLQANIFQPQTITRLAS